VILTAHLSAVGKHRAAVGRADQLASPGPVSPYALSRCGRPPGLGSRFRARFPLVTEVISPIPFRLPASARYLPASPQFP
jgi:hypothetical protein